MDRVYRSAGDLSRHLAHLRDLRERRKAELRGRSRPRLVPRDRLPVLAKTGGRCHVCGGLIREESWQADHVLAHSGGGGSAPENFLAAHKLCNGYRWDYLAEEFQVILRLGVWARTQVDKRTAVGQEIAARFVAYDARRAARRTVRT